MFKFIVTYLGFLKHVPFCAAFLEAWMTMYHSVANPRVLNAIDLVEKEVVAWPGVDISLHRFGGIQFNHDGREIGHIHGNGILDIVFMTQMKKSLLADRRVTDHHMFPNSGWISFYIQSEEDVEKAVELLKLSLSSKQKTL